MRIANKKAGICAFKFPIKESFTKNILQWSIKAQIYYAPSDRPCVNTTFTASARNSDVYS